MEAARSARGYYRLRTGFSAVCRDVGFPLRVDFRSFVSDRTQPLLVNLYLCFIQFCDTVFVLKYTKMGGIVFKASRV